MTVRLGGAVSSVTASGAAAGVDRTFGYPEKPGAFQSLAATLNKVPDPYNSNNHLNDSIAIQVLGDSTGNDSYEWVQLIAARLAKLYPFYTVKHMLWDDALQAFDAPTIVQQGTNPDGNRLTRAVGIANITGSKCFYLPGAEMPWFTNDVDIRVRLAPQLWIVGGATDQTFFARFGAAGFRAFRFQLERSSGKLNWSYTTDGTTIILAQSTVAAPGTNNVPLWVRVTHQMNNGAAGNTVTFYTSVDEGATWQVLGAPVVTAGAIAGIFNPGATIQWELLGRGQNTELTAGEVSGLQVLDGIGGLNIGVNLVDAFKPWDDGAAGSASYVAGSPELWFVNCSKPGADITYLSDATRLPKMTPNFQQVVTILSCSHNDGNRFGASYTALWDAWLAAVRLRTPSAQIVLFTQNPRTPPATQIQEHATRRRQLIAWAAKNGLSLVDVYRAFLEDARQPSALVDPADGIHPLAAGQQLWADTVMNAIARRQ